MVGSRRYDGPMKPSGSTSGWPKITATSTASTPIPTAMETMRIWARRYTRVSLGRRARARTGRQRGPSGCASTRQPYGVSRGEPEVEGSDRVDLAEHGPADQPHLAGRRPDRDHLGGDRTRRRRPPGPSGVRRPRGPSGRPAAARSRAGGVALEHAGVAEEERRLGVGRAPARRRRSGPDWTIRPARITARSSATVNASSWSWVTITAVVPGLDQDPAQVLGQALAQPGVERAQRLVEQQQPRRRGEGAGQGHALPLATGQGRRQPVGEPGQPDQVEQLGDPGVGLAARGVRRSRSG